MCTILQARAYYNEFFKGVHSCAVKDYIKPFYIPSSYKELQFAAYLLVGQQCLAVPVSFPSHKGNPRGTPIHNWRLDNYIFLYADNRSFGEIPDNFRGFRQLSRFVAEYCITNTKGLECITNPTQLIKHITKEENMKVEQELSVKTPKMKPRTNDRLVFTYTNGATYTVRGLKNAQVNGMRVHYVAVTQDSDGNTTKLETTRRITNELSTVVIEIAHAGNLMLVDLRPNSNKTVEKPARKRKSREEYEAEQAQKEAKKAKLAKVEELLDEAAKLMK